MREIKISNNDVGQRLDKFLFKYLSKAPSSFVYKMLRKKNIVLNDKKSDGKDLLKIDDVIKIYMSDETISKFSEENKIEKSLLSFKDSYKLMPDIVYEDENILIVNKPSGMLSQQAKKDDISFNEIAISYLIEKGEIDNDFLNTFKPSICNRLDRNTSGILIFAKKYIVAREMAKVLKNRSIHKYYKCIVKGKIDKRMTLSGYLTKGDNNKVSISNDNEDNIYTEIIPISFSDNISFLEVLLITGKTHQIRAHLSSCKHPIVGDYKYGDKKINEYYKKNFEIDSQMLCAYKLEIPKLSGELEYLSDKVFEIDIPIEFKRVLDNGNLEIKRS